MKQSYFQHAIGIGYKHNLGSNKIFSHWGIILKRTISFKSTRIVRRQHYGYVLFFDISSQTTFLGLTQLVIYPSCCFFCCDVSATVFMTDICLPSFGRIGKFGSRLKSEIKEHLMRLNLFWVHPISFIWTWQRNKNKSDSRLVALRAAWRQS